MAWVRPKHPPKPKPKADPVEALVPMLSYFSGRRPSSRPVSNHKAIAPVVPVPRDPVLRRLQQAQALHAEVPTTGHEHEELDHHPRRQQHHHYTSSDDEEYYEHRGQGPVAKYQRKPSPPPVQRTMRPRPRGLSYKRYRPHDVARDKPVNRHVPLPTQGEKKSSRAVSARWASATTPLDFG